MMAAAHPNRQHMDMSLGMTERVAPTTNGWHGEIRKRYTDFQVFEINKDGTVLHLQDTRPPRSQNQQPPAEELKAASGTGPDSNGTGGPGTAEEPTNGYTFQELSADDLETLSNLISQESTEKLVEMYKASLKKQVTNSEKQNNPSEKQNKIEPVMLGTIDDKEKRSQVHQLIRKTFKSGIDTTTDKDNVIIASPRKPGRAQARDRGGGRNRGGQSVRERGGEYLIFTLYKENRDTMDALHQLSLALRIKPSAINYAGTKDRRAATTQRCSIRYQKAEVLSRANTKVRGVTTGDFVYGTQPVHLGSHAGNEFVIAVKDCEVDGSPDLPLLARKSQIESCVKIAMSSMATTGWINYYGHQRFGTHAIGTHDIGKIILKEDFEGAVNAILGYDEDIATRAINGEIPADAHLRDDFNRNRACMTFQKGGSVDEALKYLPRRFAGESSLIRHLGRNPTSRRDYVGALMSITRGLRSMYIHAYQSLVWNHAASKRWATHGTNVIKGDLILSETTERVVEQDEDGDEIINAGEDEYETAKARPLTAEEAESGRYTVYDIVLPSPGYDVIYPDNDIGEFYKEFMGSDENGGLDPHAMRRRQREFSLTGHYRKLMAKFLGTPSFTVREYADDNEQMHPTDMDLINAKKREQYQEQAAKRAAPSDDAPKKRAKLEDSGVENGATAIFDAAVVPPVTEKAPETEEPKTEQPAVEATTKAAEPDKVAVVVNFQLGNSAYATVVLRELMGVPAEDPVTA